MAGSAVAGVAAELRGDTVGVAGLEAVAAGRADVGFGATSSSENIMSDNGSAFDAVFDTTGAGAAAFAGAVADLAEVVVVEAVRAAAVVVVLLALVVVGFAAVDFAAVLLAPAPVALFRSFWTLLVTLLTWFAIPLNSFPSDPLVSVTSAMVFSNSPDNSEVIRRKSRTARPACPATSGNFPGPKITRAATAMIISSHAPIPKKLIGGLDVPAATGA